MSKAYPARFPRFYIRNPGLQVNVSKKEIIASGPYYRIFVFHFTSDLVPRRFYIATLSLLLSTVYIHPHLLLSPKSVSTASSLQSEQKSKTSSNRPLFLEPKSAAAAKNEERKKERNLIGYSQSTLSTANIIIIHIPHPPTPLNPPLMTAFPLAC